MNLRLGRGKEKIMEYLGRLWGRRQTGWKWPHPGFDSLLKPLPAKEESTCVSPVETHSLSHRTAFSPVIHWT